LHFDRKSIGKAKDTVNEKNGVKGKGRDGFFWMKWDYVGLDITK